MGTTNDLNPTPLDMSGWETVFFDGFNGSQLDWQKWPITYGGSMYWNGAFYWDGSELSVGGGELTIGMSQQANGIWSAGGLSSAPYPGAPEGYGHSFTYGRVEIRAKTSAEVVGAGPCFLLWPSDLNTWPPEIDILETPSNGQGMFTNHWQGPGGNGDDWSNPILFDLDHSQWHTYALDWLPGRLTFYVDGVQIYTTTENVPDIPMSVGLQGHVGTWNDGWYGSPNGSGVSDVDISVDWVRVSQYSGNEPPVDPPDTGKVLTGTAGTDVLRGAAAADSLSGLGGADSLFGGGAADTLRGGDGADLLRGDAGDDRLLGEGGNDRLLGCAGDDRLEGGAGNDTLRGGAGDDLIATGSGADRVLFGTGEGADRVTDFALGTDKLQLVGVTAAEVSAGLATQDGATGLLLRLPGGETLFLDGLGLATAKQLGLSGSFAAAPALPATTRTVSGTAGDDWLKGGSGADYLLGGEGSDDLQGLAGNDVLRGGRGHDGLTGGAGADTFCFARGDGADWIVDFARGTDLLRLEGIAPDAVGQRLESQWGMAGLAIELGQGDGLFLQGVTSLLTAADMVYA